MKPADKERPIFAGAATTMQRVKPSSESSGEVRKLAGLRPFTPATAAVVGPAQGELAPSCAGTRADRQARTVEQSTADEGKK